MGVKLSVRVDQTHTNAYTSNAAEQFIRIKINKINNNGRKTKTKQKW